MKLFMVLLGAYPKGRLLEQHDIFFGVAASIKDLTGPIINSWPEANGDIHIDAWRTITFVDGYEISVLPKQINIVASTIETPQLFFLNLGGYKINEFEEFHYKMLIAATNKMDAIKKAKQTTFFKHTGFKGAVAHIDEKFGIDVDDIYQVEDILPAYFKERYTIQLIPTENNVADDIHLGYYKLPKVLLS